MSELQIATTVEISWNNYEVSAHDLLYKENQDSPGKSPWLEITPVAGEYNPSRTIADTHVKNVLQAQTEPDMYMLRSAGEAVLLNMPTFDKPELYLDQIINMDVALGLLRKHHADPEHAPTVAGIFNNIAHSALTNGKIWWAEQLLSENIATTTTVRQESDIKSDELEGQVSRSYAMRSLARQLNADPTGAEADLLAIDDYLSRNTEQRNPESRDHDYMLTNRSDKQAAVRDADFIAAAHLAAATHLLQGQHVKALELSSTAINYTDRSRAAAELTPNTVRLGNLLIQGSLEMAFVMDLPDTALASIDAQVANRLALAWVYGENLVKIYGRSIRTELGLQSLPQDPALKDTDRLRFRVDTRYPAQKSVKRGYSIPQAPKLIFINDSPEEN